MTRACQNCTLLSLPPSSYIYIRTHKYKMSFYLSLTLYLVFFPLDSSSSKKKKNIVSSISSSGSNGTRSRSVSRFSCGESKDSISKLTGQKEHSRVAAFFYRNRACDAYYNILYNNTCVGVRTHSSVNSFILILLFSNIIYTYTRTYDFIFCFYIQIPIYIYIYIKVP